VHGHLEHTIGELAGAWAHAAHLTPEDEGHRRVDGEVLRGEGPGGEVGHVDAEAAGAEVADGVLHVVETAAQHPALRPARGPANRAEALGDEVDLVHPEGLGAAQDGAHVVAAPHGLAHRDDAAEPAVERGGDAGDAVGAGGEHGAV
jgi:hypothetical protein